MGNTDFTGGVRVSIDFAKEIEKTIEMLLKYKLIISEDRLRDPIYTITIVKID